MARSRTLSLWLSFSTPLSPTFVFSGHRLVDPIVKAVEEASPITTLASERALVNLRTKHARTLSLDKGLEAPASKRSRVEDDGAAEASHSPIEAQT
ncbi:hypothetical protein B0T24DRAFT_638610 [Lasiosphaeria ovina]|uniref:Uncharacterized protein n=1 Tax=Lasiosphaeria ovina TaxID=92902 RepID=A0AAE0JVL3_9PEZI|nr:hypothetical protein B0T24DRAFT_638610 [Lasiosphaeria ovina]